VPNLPSNDEITRFDGTNLILFLRKLRTGGAVSTFESHRIKEETVIPDEPIMEEECVFHMKDEFIIQDTPIIEERTLPAEPGIKKEPVPDGQAGPSIKKELVGVPVLPEEPDGQAGPRAKQEPDDQASPGIIKEPVDEIVITDESDDEAGPNTEDELILMEESVIHKKPTRTAEQPSPPRYVP
jgi:hypothetical protein